MSPVLKPSTSRLVLLALWAAASLFMLWKVQPYIGAINFRDPDDALRFVQVRDLLGGQNWFDLTQYRINPPHGVPMHWSRLVDLPLALGLLALEPLLGERLATQVTLGAVPLLYLLGLFFMVRALCRRLALSEPTALLATALLASSISILVQFSPMRIDHHGAQVFYGMLAMLPLVGTSRRDGLMGFLAGIAASFWMQVSMEGLPYAVVIGGIFGLRFLWRAENWADLRAYLPALTLGSALLLLAGHGWAGSLLFWCDAMSPTYLLPLAAVSAALLIAGRTIPRATLFQRALPLGLAGLAGIATYLSVSRQCLAGPFATLDPLVYELWYLNVLEGMPIYRQSVDLQALIVLPALLGLAGSVIALRRAPSEDLRIAWASLLVMQIAAFALALDVMRAMTFAHLVALPGAAVLFATLAAAAQRLSLRLARVPLTAAVALLTPFGATTAAIAVVGTGTESESKSLLASRYECAVPARLRGLNALPVTTLFTPLDIGSHVLAYTRHSVVGTGHHRNLDGMKAVMHGFAERPADARAILFASHASHIAFCPGTGEVVRLQQARPQGLLAELGHGRHPDWLAPVPMRKGETIQVYRIIR